MRAGGSRRGHGRDISWLQQFFGAGRGGKFRRRKPERNYPRGASFRRESVRGDEHAGERRRVAGICCRAFKSVEFRRGRDYHAGYFSGEGDKESLSRNRTAP